MQTLRRAVHAWLRCVLLLCALIVLSTCARGQKALFVNVSGIPNGAAALGAFAVVQQTVAREQPELELPSARQKYSFVLLLQDADRGTAHVQVFARDADRCVVSASVAEVDLQQTADAFVLQLDVALAPLQGTPCQRELPIVAQASPDHISSAGGEQVVLSGVGLRPDVQLQIDGIPSPVTWLSPAQIRTTTPRRLGRRGPTEVALTASGAGTRTAVATPLSTYLGDVSFATNVLYPIAHTADQLVVADFDNDSWPDVAVAGSVGGTPVLTLLHNAQNGQFQPWNSFAVDRVTGLTTGDLNADGLIDIVLGASSAPNAALHLLINQGQGRFARVEVPIQTTITGTSDLFPSFADIDHDGLLDLMFTGPTLASGATRLEILMNRRTHFSATEPLQFIFNGGSIVKGFADYNNDKFDDIVLHVNATMLLYLNQRNGTFASVPLVRDLPELNIYLTDIIDLDNDGLADSIFCQPNQAILLFTKSGGAIDAPLQASLDPPSVSGSSLCAFVADFNGDGLPDILNPSNPTTGLHVNLGHRSFSNRELPTSIADAVPTYYLKWIDVNKDGLADKISLGGGIPGTLLARINKSQ